jgi:hypothetical protein
VSYHAKSQPLCVLLGRNIKFEEREREEMEKSSRISYIQLYCMSDLEGWLVMTR